MSGYTVEIQGLEKLMKKLTHITDPFGDLVKEAAEYGKKEMKVFAKPHEADKGTLAEATTYELAGRGVNMQARVGLIGRGHGMRSSLAGLAPTINYGRRPGKPPPIATIERWGVRHGFIQSGKGYRLAHHIRQYGTKGVLFLEKTEAVLNKELPKMVEKTKRRVEKDWGS